MQALTRLEAGSDLCECVGDRWALVFKGEAADLFAKVDLSELRAVLRADSKEFEACEKMLLRVIVGLLVECVAAVRFFPVSKNY